MLEVQKKWYLPNLTSLGWHMGFWNLVGAIGFTLCGALGFAGQKTSIEYAGTLSTFIGSWAFLVSVFVPCQRKRRSPLVGHSLTQRDRLEALCSGMNP